MSKTSSTPAPAKKTVQTKKAAPVKKEAQKVEEVPVEEVPVEETPVEESPVEDSTPKESVESRLKEALLFIDNQMKELKSFKTTIKSLITDYQKEVRENKNKKKRVRSTKPQTPHGFTKPVHISADLCAFLKVDKETTIARPSVTSKIAQYVRENELYESSNKSIFKPDATLKKILGEPLYPVEPKKPELGLGYGYKNLQKYLSPHFLKA